MTSPLTQLEELAGKADEHSAVLNIISDFIDYIPHIQKDVKAVAAFLEEFTTLAPSILSALKAVEWQPIETAPRDGTEILLWGALSGPKYDRENDCWGYGEVTEQVVSLACFRRGMWQTGGFNSPKNPTHWRPLGPVPENEHGRMLGPFIIPAPDPLVEMIESLRSEPFHRDAPSQAKQFRDAAERLGYTFKLERIDQ